MPFRNVSKVEKPIIVSGIVVLLFSFAILIISVFQFGIGVSNCVTNMTPFQKGEVIAHDSGHYEVHYVAKMWSFEPNEVHVPPGAQVDIYLTSTDVTHGFEIPGTDVNLMAVPGVVNYARVKFPDIGTRSVICHEYCGTGHHDMAAKIFVEYEWMMGQNVKPQAENIPRGMKLMQDKGCIACHTVTGAPGTGPTLKGLFGKTEKLNDGSSVVVDDAYIRESILEPQAKIVQGYGAIMPKFQVSPEDLNEIVNTIKTLK